MKWFILGVVFVIWFAYVLEVVAQDDDLQQQLNDLKQEQLWLEHDIQMQRLRHQQDRMFYRQQYGNDIERTLEVERIIREVKQREREREREENE